MKRLIEGNRMIPHPPNDWNNIEGWDKYWLKIINENSRYVSQLLQKDIFFTEFEGHFKERGVKKILFLGNGISQAPKFFVYLGFTVVALDLSKVATDYARSFEYRYQEFYKHFNGDPFRINKKVWLKYCESAKNVSFISGSLLNPETAPGPFDLIISSRTIQGFAKEDMLQSAIYLIDKRLSAQGCFFNITHNNRLAKDLIDQELENLDYLIIKRKPEDYLPISDRKIGWNLFGSG